MYENAVIMQESYLIFKKALLFRIFQSITYVAVFITNGNLLA